MLARLSEINLHHAFRLWLVVFVLLFSQWVLNTHEHDENHALDESCQYCQLTGHFHFSTSGELSLTSTPNSQHDQVIPHNALPSLYRSIYTARAPPQYL